MGALYHAKKIRKVLVVCPLSITGVWLEELGKFAAFDYRAAILEGTMAKKTAQLQRLCGHALQVAVVNYESAWRMESELFDWDADIIVCDERHKLKTHNTKQSKALHTLGRRARYRMLLTGKLITNKAIDVFSQYKFLSPSIFGQSFYSFRSRYFDMTGYGFGDLVYETRSFTECRLSRQQILLTQKVWETTELLKTKFDMAHKGWKFSIQYIHKMKLRNIGKWQ